MNFSINIVDEIAAQGHRHELEEQARIERLLLEARAETHQSRLPNSLMWLLRWRRHDKPADDETSQG